jgi:hypothetical protein
VSLPPGIAISFVLLGCLHYSVHLNPLQRMEVTFVALGFRLLQRCLGF